MDLAQVEGLADLLQAETEAQRIQALAQMEGDLSKLYRKWTDELKKVLLYHCFSFPRVFLWVLFCKCLMQQPRQQNTKWRPGTWY